MTPENALASLDSFFTIMMLLTGVGSLLILGIWAYLLIQDGKELTPDSLPPHEDLSGAVSPHTAPAPPPNKNKVVEWLLR